MNTLCKFASLVIFMALAIVASGICRALPDPPSFTDTRTTPVGNDLLAVSFLQMTDTWSVDLIMNHTDTETNGKLNAEEQISRIWSGTGPDDASTTINTVQKLHVYYLNGIGYYQYQFHDTRSSSNKQYDINAPVYSYSL